MTDLVCFCLRDNIFYCPIHLNRNILTTNCGEIGDLPVSEDILNNIIRQLDSKAHYIIDFSGCTGSIEMSPPIMKSLAKSNTILITSEKVKQGFLLQKILEKDSVKKFGLSDKESWILPFDSNNTLHECMEYAEQKVGSLESIDFFNKLILTQFFYHDISQNDRYDFAKGNLKYLESSNVYVNKYINVKSLFLNYNYMMLVIKGLHRIIKRQFAKYLGEISLLGVSNNGIILANLLSYELNVPVQSLNRLGPVYCLEENVNKLNNFTERKYILVSDVVCMGGEFRMAKGIVDILGSQLIGGICVVKIRNVYREGKDEKVFALLNDINEFEIEGKRIDYQVFIDKDVISKGGKDT